MICSKIFKNVHIYYLSDNTNVLGNTLNVDKQF